MAKLHTLSNGVRVVCDPIAGFETLALSVVVGRGSRSENAAQAGWAHLLEHMVFKGAGERSPREIVEAVESRGGHINAATSHERTSFQIRALKADLAVGLEVISDLVRHPVLLPEEIEREKGVIAQEIAEAADTPDDLVYEMAHRAAFGDTGLGRPILGTVESVARANHSDLCYFRAGLYAPDRIVISVAGAVDEDEVLELAERWFGGPGPDVEPLPAPEAASFAGGAAVRTARLEQAHMVMMLPTFGAGHDDYFALRLFAEILGGGMSSRLFQEVREKHGLAYNIDAYAETYSDIGSLGIYAGSAAGDAEKTARITGEVTLALAEAPSEAEMARAKAQMKGGMFMARESAMARAEQSAGQTLLLGRVVPTAELAERIEAVGLEDIRRVGRGALAGGLSAHSVLGPKSASPAGEAFHQALFG